MTALDRLSSGWKAWIILFLLTLTSAAPGVFSLPALDRDESRFAQASKQMLETGDYIRIRYQDELRNKKPAGIHWLQAGATAAFSDAEDLQIWSYRVPSWIGASLATLAAFWCGLVLIGRRAAFLGAAMFGATLLLTSEAHISKTDGVLVFLTTLGMGALARLYIRQDNDKRLALLFWLAMGLGFLIKGPVTPMVAAFAMAVLYVWDGRKHDWMRSLLWWPGPALFVILVLPWFIWIQLATDGQYVQGAVGKDLKDKLVSASEGHGGLPGYHLLHIPAWFFPGSLLFAPMIVLTWQAIRTKAADLRAGLAPLDGIANAPHVQAGRDEAYAGLKYLVAWAVPTWIFFELLLTKLSHYILPAYPAFALLCGFAAVELMSGARAKVSRFASAILFTLGGGALIAVSHPAVAKLVMSEAAGDFKTISSEQVMNAWSPYLAMPSYWLWGIGAAALVAAVALFLVNRVTASIGAGILASIFIGWHARAVFLPSQVWVQPTVTAQIALSDVCGLPSKTCDDGRVSPNRVVAVGYAEPSYVMTVGTQNLHPPESVVAIPETKDGFPAVFLINLEDPAGPPALQKLRTDALAAERQVSESSQYYALNYSNGDPVAFIAMRID